MMFLRNNAVGLALFVLAGCNGAASPEVAPPSPVSGNDGVETVVLRIEGMNERLKIMWSDWPNSVKQALAELDGVQSVKDEWEHDQEADGTLDTLHVNYDPRRATVEQMLQTIKSQGYEGRLATSQDEPSEQ